jgi:hypothetical protein
MKKWQISSILIVLAVLLIGTASAAVSMSVGDGWHDYYVPAGTAPVASSDNPFTYSSDGPTHIMITDMYCVGDVPAVYEGDVLLGAGNPVVSEYPSCTGVYDADTAYAGDFSHACINVPQSGRHAFDIVNIQMYADTADGGAVKVEAGVCPGTPQAPEFPSIALPVAMILGFVFIVYSLRARKE